MKRNFILLFTLLHVLNLGRASQEQYSISQLSPKSMVSYEEEDETIHSSAAYINNEPFSNINERSVIIKGIGDDVKAKMKTKIQLSNVITPTKTKKHYESKTSEKNDPFLVKRDRGAPLSRSFGMEKMSVSPKTIVLNNNKSAARQSNADIQDIISGIVKLLNGNVNVHTNNQGGRIQINNRINNRGPPKIAEAQLPFSDIHDINHDANKIISSQSYPFDRPERPFLTGVPLPEQIVPSMQQNFRPGFISQNRPPWKRPKPRPSLTRRPYPSINRPIPAQFNATRNDTFQNDVLYNATSISFITTIIQSTSEVNTVTYDDDNDDDLVIEINDTETIKKNPSLESSINENFVHHHHQSTITQTPSLETSTQLKTSIIDVSTASAETNRQTSTYFPRLGVVLDDPDFKPGKNSFHSKTASHLQQDFGYGEIFDVTLTAIQGPSGNLGSQQTVNINPYNKYQSSDVLVKPSGDQNFVSIDGKRSYFNLFSDFPRDSSSVHVEPTGVLKEIKGTGYVQPENVSVKKTQSFPLKNQFLQKHKTTPLQNVRIDTCIIGDDSTCDQSQNEKCKIENGISSCNCREGYARRKHREICRKIVSLLVSVRVDKLNDKKLLWDSSFNDSTEFYRSLKYESFRAIDSAMSMTPFSDEFIDAKINAIKGDTSKDFSGVFVNFTIMMEENNETLQPKIKNEIQRHLIGVIHRRNNNIGNSNLFVSNPLGSVSAVQDLDECTESNLNDCHEEAVCSNVFGTYRCQCKSGFKDPYSDINSKAGRDCQTCEESFCNNRGECSYDTFGSQTCSCLGSYYGTNCEVDGEILVVAIGASVAALIIIILTLICLIMWSRRWQREHKNAMIGTPLFGFMNGNMQKSCAIGNVPYQVGLEERIRWAQIADVMAQANHYAVEPVMSISNRPPTIFGYQSNLNTLNTQCNNSTLPVPLPRLTAMNRGNGNRNFENSSSSEEEDRTDLLSRNFHVPRPKSRSNASVTSAIYYDVDYLPSGDQTSGIYNTTNNNQIPLSTYGMTYSHN